MTTVLEFNANEIIKDALEDTGIIPPGQNSPPSLQDKCLRIMNRLLKEWQAGPNRLWLQTEGVVFINPGQEFYLLGPSGDFSCKMEELVPTTLSADAASGDLDIFVTDASGLTGAPDLMPFDPIDSTLWESFNGGVISTQVNVGGSTNLVVTNSLGISGSGTLDIPLDDAIEDYIFVINNTSGSGEVAIFAIKDPNDERLDRILLGTGINSDGQIGNASQDKYSEFTQEQRLATDWLIYSAGNEHSVAIRKDGTLWGTGNNFHGQLGLGPLAGVGEQPEYVQEISESTDWVFCFAGSNFSIAIKEIDGERTLWSCGDNEFGQLATNDFHPRDVYTQEASLRVNWDYVAAPKKVSKINFAMAIQEIAGDRTIWGVGSNGSGQLGTNDGENDLIFLQEALDKTDWAMSSSGTDFTMAIDTAGKLWATGSNASGQFGDGGLTDDTLKFIQIGTDTDYEAVACGSDFTLIIKSGLVLGTGNNDTGQLGIGDEDSGVNQFTPSLLSVDDFAMTAAGADFSIAIRNDGTLWGSGKNDVGQLGLGDQNDRPGYIQIGSATDWTYVACGEKHTIVTNSTGEVWGTGDNTYGQLGLGTVTTPQLTLAKSTTTETPTTVSCGVKHTMLRVTGGKIFGAGNNDRGQLGTGNTTQQTSFTQAGTGTDWNTVEAGDYHTMAIDDDTKLYGTGSNDQFELAVPYGQLGDIPPDKQSFTQSYLPVKDAIKEISTSLINVSHSRDNDAFSAIIRNDGTLWTTGKNQFGQLGQDTDTNIDYYQQEANGFTNWVKVACGNAHMFAMRDDGTLWSCGRNDNGQLGQGNTTDLKKLTQVGTDTNWIDFDCGTDNTTAINFPLPQPAFDVLTITYGCGKSTGLAQYGYTDDRLVFSPFAERQAGTFLDADAGDAHVMYIKNNGTLWGFGENAVGQLGTGDTLHRPFGTQIGSDSDWEEVRCGKDFTMARKSDDSLWGTGKNNFGQLGINTTDDVDVFTQEFTESEWGPTMFDCGDDFTLAWLSPGNPAGGDLVNPGAVYGTGNNNVGQLAQKNFDGPLTTFGVCFRDPHTHGGVSALPNHMISPVKLSCGGQHAAIIDYLASAIAIDSFRYYRLWTTGNNEFGQLGRSDTDNRDNFGQEDRLFKGWLDIACGRNISVGIVDKNVQTPKDIAIVHNTGWVFGAGQNSDGQLGQTDPSIHTRFQEADDTDQGTNTNFSYAVTCGGFFSSILKYDSYDNDTDIGTNPRKYSTGANQLGQLGLGYTSDPKFRFTQAESGAPTKIFSGSNFAGIEWVSENPPFQGVAEMALFGGNEIGQLGRGDFSTSEVIPEPPGESFEEGLKVACGDGFTIIISHTEQVYCVGENDFGQLGIGRYDDNPTLFIEKTNHEGAEEVACGLNHTAVRNKSNDQIWTTGNNHSGQLALNNTIERFNTFQYTGTHDSIGVACGAEFTSHINNRNELYSAGNNSEGQLGLGSGSSTTLIQFTREATDSTTWRILTAGGAVLMASETDSLKTTGIFINGITGNGRLENETYPAYTSEFVSTVLPCEGAQSVSAGSQYTTVLDSGVVAVPADEVSFTQSYLPVKDAIKEISISLLDNDDDGFAFSAIIRQDGTLWTAGRNRDGQLGQDTVSNAVVEYYLQEANGFTNWIKVSCGNAHLFAIRDDGTLWSCGSNNRGQLGQGDRIELKKLTQVGTDTTWIDVAGGVENTVAINSKDPNGNIAYGCGLAGGLAQYESTEDELTFTPLCLTESVEFLDADAGEAHVMYVKSNGTLWGYGRNDEGQLGTGDDVDRRFGTQIGTDRDWEHVRCGDHFTMARKTDRTLWGTGLNTSGQLGIGNSNSVQTFTQETRGFIWDHQFDCGSNFTLAENADDGYLYGTGDNSVGQLAQKTFDGTYTEFAICYRDPSSDHDDHGEHMVPHTLSCGAQHASLTEETGGGIITRLWSTGHNSNGQLGDDSTTNRAFFVEEDNEDTFWVAVSCGAAHTVAIGDRENDTPRGQPIGQPFGAGKNTNGQLGLATTDNVLTFTPSTGTLDHTQTVSCSNNFTIITRFQNKSYFEPPIVYGAGSNAQGQLVLQQVSEDVREFTSIVLEGLDQIFTGRNFTGFHTSSNQLTVVGDNTLRQCGRGDISAAETHFSPIGEVFYGINQVACGEVFTMVVTKFGDVWGTGQNDKGQLGVGGDLSVHNTLTKSADFDKSSGIVQVACGERHSVVRTNNRKVFSTGDNRFGQLAINNTNTEFNTFQFTGTTDSLHIACGANFTSHINDTHRLYSAGHNNEGQLGLGSGSSTIVYAFTQEVSGDFHWGHIGAGGDTLMGTQTNLDSLLSTGKFKGGQTGNGRTEGDFTSVFVTTVLPCEGAQSVSAGSEYTAVIDAGRIFSVGLDTHGQLGTDKTPGRMLIQEVTRNINWTEIACGYDFSTAIDSDGHLSSTGNNDVGQLGLGPTGAATASQYTRESSGNDTWVSLAPGNDFAHAQQFGSRLLATGANARGQFGITHNVEGSNSYITIHEQITAENIACGVAFSAVLNDGHLYTTGDNSKGQLGIDNTNIDAVSRFEEVENTLFEWDSMACGDQHLMAITSTNTLYGTGLNEQGQLGVNSNTNSYTLINEDNNLSTWTQVACGTAHTCAIANNILYGTGDNTYGQIALPNDDSSAKVFTVERSTISIWDFVECGSNFSIARRTTGVIYGTGQNDTGELGLNDTRDRFTYTQIGTDTEWTVISCGHFFTMALQVDGSAVTLWGTGQNNRGQLGIDTQHSATLYQQESLLATDWKTVSCGGNVSVAVNETGHLFGTGDNSEGELGINNQDPVAFFTEEFRKLGNWTDASCGENFTVAINDQFEIYATGLNSEGQLGSGNTVDKSVFTQEVLESTNWKKVSAGSEFVMALTDEGEIWGVGSNNFGQLGSGDFTAPFLTYTRTATEEGVWEDVTAGSEYALASLKEEYFADLVSVTVSEDGEVFMPFSPGELKSALFSIEVDDATEGSAVSIDALLLRDPTDTGDIIGIQLDELTRFWTKISVISDDNKVTLVDALPAAAAEGNSVYAFKNLIDRPLQVYNGRRTFYSVEKDNAEIRVEDWSREEYMNQALKSSAGPTSRMYYNPTLKDGTLYTWQTGTTVTEQLRFTYNEPFEVAEHQTDIPQIPSEWAMALKWGIAQQLITGHGIDQAMAAQINQNAQKSLREARSNYSPYVMQFNPLGRR